jgi:hypothetical protein
MRMAPTGAMDVLLGIPPLHVMIEAEAKAGIYRLMCSQQRKPKFTNFGHARKCWDMEHESLLQIGTDMMIPRYAYHKPFTSSSSTCASSRTSSNDIKGGLVWYRDGS